MAALKSGVKGVLRKTARAERMCARALELVKKAASDAAALLKAVDSVMSDERAKRAAARVFPTDLAKMTRGQLRRALRALTYITTNGKQGRKPSRRLREALESSKLTVTSVSGALEALSAKKGKKAKKEAKKPVAKKKVAKKPAAKKAVSKPKAKEKASQAPAPTPAASKQEPVGAGAAPSKTTQSELGEFDKQ